MVYCRTVHCFLKIWSNKRTHPNERRNAQRPPCCHSWRHSRWQRNGQQTNELSGRIFTHNLGNSTIKCNWYSCDVKWRDKKINNYSRKLLSRQSCSSCCVFLGSLCTYRVVEVGRNKAELRAPKWPETVSRHPMMLFLAGTLFCDLSSREIPADEWVPLGRSP